MWTLIYPGASTNQKVRNCRVVVKRNFEPQTRFSIWLAQIATDIVEEEPRTETQGTEKWFTRIIGKPTNLRGRHWKVETRDCTCSTTILRSRGRIRKALHLGDRFWGLRRGGLWERCWEGGAWFWRRFRDVRANGLFWRVDVGRRFGREGWRGCEPRRTWFEKGRVGGGRLEALRGVCFGRQRWLFHRRVRPGGVVRQLCRSWR